MRCHRGLRRRKKCSERILTVMQIASQDPVERSFELLVRHSVTKRIDWTNAGMNIDH